MILLKLIDGNEMFRFTSAIIFCLFITISTHVTAQPRQLTSIGPVERVAFVNYSRLHKEYVALKVAREKFSNSWRSVKAAYNEKKQVLKNGIEAQLKQDSISGFSNKRAIEVATEEALERLSLNYQREFKKLHEERVVLFREYERKITFAINQIVGEHGITSVKPLTEKVSEQKVLDITDRVLQKLN